MGNYTSSVVPKEGNIYHCPVSLWNIYPYHGAHGTEQD